jgi:hypothetical protein
VNAAGAGIDRRRQKLRRMRHRTLWPDSAIIQIDLE